MGSDQGWPQVELLTCERAAPTAPLQPHTVSSRSGSPGEPSAARRGGTGPEHPAGAAPYVTGNYLCYKTRLKGPQIPERHRQPGQQQQPGRHAASTDGCATSPTFPGREDAPFRSAAAAAAIQTVPCPRPSPSPFPSPPRQPRFGAHPPGRGARPLRFAAGCRLSSPPDARGSAGRLLGPRTGRTRAAFSQRRLFAPGRLGLPAGLSSATRSRASRAGQSLGAAPAGAGRSEGRGRPGGTRGAGGERRPQEESRSAAQRTAPPGDPRPRDGAAPHLSTVRSLKNPPLPHPERHKGTAARGRGRPAALTAWPRRALQGARSRPGPPQGSALPARAARGPAAPRLLWASSLAVSDRSLWVCSRLAAEVRAPAAQPRSRRSDAAMGP